MVEIIHGKVLPEHFRDSHSSKKCSYCQLSASFPTIVHIFGKKTLCCVVNYLAMIAPATMAKSITLKIDFLSVVGKGYRTG